MDCSLAGQGQCCKCSTKVHLENPLHRIKKWNGRHFEDADPGELGLTIHLGHGGDLCPSASPPDDERDDEFESGDEDEDEVLRLIAPPLQRTRSGSQDIVIVHTTGIFSRRAQWCSCPNASSRNLQLLNLRLFPATTRQPKTCFTFDVLDLFHLEAMECKTSALNFMRKLQRLTSPMFPSLVPVSSKL
jgi:CxC2 like cysteine cluster associated with KDZ transposases